MSGELPSALPDGTSGGWRAGLRAVCAIRTSGLRPVSATGVADARGTGDRVTSEFTLTQTGTESTALAFSDADGCARWLRAQPLSNIPKHYDQLLGQLHRLTEADLTPRERARIAEVLREPVHYLHTELARRYAGKPHPATEREHEAAEQALALWQALWAQYSACLKPLLEGDPELQGVKAKLLQRGLWVGKQIVLVHGLARVLSPGRDTRVRRHGGIRRADAQRRRRVLLLDLFTRALAQPRGPVRPDCQADRAGRSLAGHVGAQGFPLCAAARDRGAGDRQRPRRPSGRHAVARRAAPRE